MGVDLNGDAKAYPFEALVDQRVINDIFAGRDLLVTFDPVSETGRIFDRTLGDRVISFELLSGQPRLTRIHRTKACGKPSEEAKGCSFESGIMVLKQQTDPRTRSTQ